MKTPEQYLRDMPIPDAAGRGGPLNGAEQAFLDKYVGVGAEDFAAQVARVDPRGEPLGPGMSALSDMAAGRAAPEDFEEKLKEAAEVQLVGFRLGTREFALPIIVIQEVIRYEEPTKVPRAPGFVAGVINLRGTITCMLSLQKLVEIPENQWAAQDFFVICRYRGLQVGLMIHAVSTMYRAMAGDLTWNVESQVGTGAQYLLGLLKKDDKIINILSIDRLVESLFMQ